jgi:uncharacterized Zn-finger protein
MGDTDVQKRAVFASERLATAGFTSRPSVVALPTFQLPAPQTEIPRLEIGSTGPMSSANTASSQSSSAVSSYGHGQPGSWPTPRGSVYTYGSSNPSSQSLPSSYASRGTVYRQSSSMPYSSMSSKSPATGNEGLTPSQDDTQVQSTFSTSRSSSRAGNAASAAPGPASLATQGQRPQSAMTSAQSPYGPTSTPRQTTYPSYASPHPSPSHPSPRSVSTTGMAPPQPYRPLPYYSLYRTIPGQQMNGPIMSNLTNPGGDMLLVPGMGVHHGYGQMSPHIYGHGPSQAQQERPFKCDQCPQSFNRNHDLKRHRRIHLAVKPFPCTFCEKSFSRKDALKVCAKY